MGSMLSTVIIGVLLLFTLHVPMLGLLNAVLSADPLWTGTYGGAKDDWARSVIETSDGGYTIAGATCSFSVSGLADSFLVKTDALGTIQWNRTYGEGYDDGFGSVIQTEDGGYAMAGYAAGTTDDGYFVKTDAAGNEQWRKVIRGTGDEFLNCVIQTGDGGYALAGQTDSFGDRLFYDAYLIKTDSLGNIQWKKTYGGTWDAVAHSVVQTSDGGYALAGSYSLVAGYSDFWLVKTDSDGNHLWNRTYGGGSASSIVLASDGGYALAGANRLVRTDGLGNMQWNRTFGGTDYVDIGAVIRTDDDGYVLAGHARYLEADSADAWLAKTDSCGNTVWRKTYGGEQDDLISSATQTSDGGYALAGWTEPSDTGDEDFCLVKTESIMSPIHEVAIADMHLSKTIICRPYVCQIDTVVVNRGDYVETFNVTLWAMDAPPAENVQSYWVLAIWPDETRTTTVVWNTTGWSCGNYTISAYAEPVSGEADIANNARTYGCAVVTISGDVDGDFEVDIFDVVKITNCYGKQLGGALYNPNADIDGNGVVNILDVAICTGNYGQKWP